MKELVLAYSPWGNGNSITPFDAVFTYAVDAKSHGFGQADAFILWGGTDIHPSFYKSAAHRMNQAPALPSDRDVWEWKAMQHCKANNIPIIGVCRGAQFMCAFAGGKLVQHVNSHNGGNHQVVTKDGEMFGVTSAHHQMMDVEGTRHELLAWTPSPLSTLFFGETSETPAHIKEGLSTNTFAEPEAVFFPDIMGLAIQGHPEWANKNSPFASQCNDWVLEYLLNNKEWT